MTQDPSTATPDGATVVPVLLAGGSGTRLWPVSRKSFPKQFAPLMGDRSLFQASAERLSGPRYAEPLVLTNADFRFVVAEQMAVGAAAWGGADLAVATTGVAGPGGGTETKPVGTVCFGVALRDRPTVTVTRKFPGDRERVRSLTTTAALHLVVRALTSGTS